MAKLWLLVLAATLCCGGSALAETVRFDFESGDLQGWRVVEGKFGQLVCGRDREHNVPQSPYSKEGKWFLSTLERDNGTPYDGFTGIVDSPVVVLSAPEVKVRVGGGAGDKVYFAVCSIDGKVVASARGRNHEHMYPQVIQVPELVGKPVFFRAFDGATGGWGHVTVDEVVCEGRIDPAATAKHFDDMRKAQNLAAMKRFAGLPAAFEELGKRFSEYPATEFRAAYDRACEAGDAEGLEKLQAEALVKENPLVNRQPILFTTRGQYRSDHHNTATLFQCGEINEAKYVTQGALKLLDVKTGKVTVVVPELPGRTVRDPELDPSGTKVVFSMRTGKDEDYKIWTVNVDGSGLRQLTFAKGVTDIDPAWLPDGDIVFSSTREPKYCMCNRHIMCNLFRMRPNGANIIQIGKSTLFEGHSSVLPDGRVLYDRWEYVDRNFGDAQGLWVCNPDGTGHAIFWGNNTTSPGGVINARPIGDSTSRVIAVLGSCHDRPWGALGVIDRNLGVDGKSPVVQTWPADYRNRIHTGGEDFDSTKSIGLKFSDPFPLDDGHFLCSRMTGRGEESGLAYVDRFGNEVLFYFEAPGCWSPMPVRASKTAPVIPTRRDYSHPNGPGYFYLQDVYVGTHMDGVKRGEIKSLRIVESPEKRNWTGPTGWFGHGEMAAAMNWHSFENKRILGTVPVADDGSAYFEVPGNTFVYFQALDANGKMVQSMRSGAYVQPGETYGCVGCHESRVGNVPPISRLPSAMSRKASKLNGWYGKPRLFSFQREVQPVFDRHCVKCHDYGKPAGEKLNLSGGRDTYFNVSYVDLWALGAISCVGGGPAEIRPARSWGSSVSKLVRELEGGHANVKLSPEELDRIVTWIDINAPYYPCYEVAYPNNPGGRSPLTKEELQRIMKLTGGRIANAHSARQRAQLDFGRPECSRILSKLDKNTQREAYDAVLGLVRAGAERLREQPRADMDGFVPCAKDREREERYRQRAAQELRVYEAIRNGRELMDE